MVKVERGQELHLRACRGDTLTIEERDKLNSWYSEMDAGEELILSSATTHADSTDRVHDQIRQTISDVSIPAGR